MRPLYKISLLLAACSTAAASVAVNTTSGRYIPYFTDSQPRVASFLDIPYAENPTGELRFSPPVPKRYPGGDAVQATNLPAGCIQYVAANFRGIVSDLGVTAAEFQRGDYSNTTEDCLRLSIFAPRETVVHAASKKPSKNGSLPVVIWVHGGGYNLGGTNMPFQLPSNWVARSQRHIVVQVQYRLNLLGAPNAAGLADNGTNLNLAALDYRLATEWVRDNIASFGGDPHRITLWGESAGAYGVDSYLFAYPKDPIVKGVIADSGNAVAMENVLLDATNHSTFSLAASRLGCGNLTALEELQCMRNVPESSLKHYLQSDIGAGGAVDDGLTFGFIADNVTIFNDYHTRIGGSGDQFPKEIPLLIGTNTEEGTAVVPYNFEGSETATELPSNLEEISQAFKLYLQCTTLREARIRAEAGAATYQYLYAGNFTNISPRPWLGAYHTAELPLIFGTHGIEGPSTNFEKRVSERMQDLYLRFISDPVRGLEKAGWPEATGQAGTSMIIVWGADGNVEQVMGTKGLHDECVNSSYPV
ncbi:related to triacylglycerol lipase V precursor [Cephalotrichum gorgonifer]|uniref:Carboxylic ester hydrolase n=1 Tax=Cephalotrichum gorgonifer TaxID=2041049 RepID=A0AAE8MW97_9PEZI|nr:related to triacylglycerol lipase V precursor [Cephalotrichum gorgonifer]